MEEPVVQLWKAIVAGTSAILIAIIGTFHRMRKRTTHIVDPAYNRRLEDLREKHEADFLRIEGSIKQHIDEKRESIAVVHRRIEAFVAEFDKHVVEANKVIADMSEVRARVANLERQRQEDKADIIRTVGETEKRIEVRLDNIHRMLQDLGNRRS